LNLLCLSPWCPYPPDNGARIRVFHLLEQLSTRHAITLVTFKGRGGDPEAAELRRLCRAVHVVEGDPFVAEPLGLHGLLSRVPRSYVQSFNGEVHRIVNQCARSVDAAVLFEMIAGVYVQSVGPLPVLVDGLELARLYDQFNGEPRQAARLRRKLTWLKAGAYARLLTARAGAVSVVSEAEKRHFERAGCDPARIAVIPNGARAADLAVSCAKQPGTVVLPGSVTYDLNLDAVRYFAGDIWPLVRRACPGARALVTGRLDGVDVRDLTHVPGLTLTGYVDDVKSVVASSRACVVPLRGGGGTRTKILEAMALGTPVVATSKGAEGLAVSPGRDILIGDSADAFAAHIVALLADDEAAARIACQARSLVAREYTWEAIAPRFEQLLLDLRVRRAD
jgi:glycosyltransferase involved in cell wall biosynthesis